LERGLPKPLPENRMIEQEALGINAQGFLLVCEVLWEGVGTLSFKNGFLPYLAYASPNRRSAWLMRSSTESLCSCSTERAWRASKGVKPRATNARRAWSSSTASWARAGWTAPNFWSSLSFSSSTMRSPVRLPTPGVRLSVTESSATTAAATVSGDRVDSMARPAVAPRRPPHAGARTCDCRSLWRTRRAGGHPP
jgi:hypothetical protein